MAENGDLASLFGPEEGFPAPENDVFSGFLDPIEVYTGSLTPKRNEAWWTLSVHATALRRRVRDYPEPLAGPPCTSHGHRAKDTQPLGDPVCTTAGPGTLLRVPFSSKWLILAQNG